MVHYAAFKRMQRRKCKYHARGKCNFFTGIIKHDKKTKRELWRWSRRFSWPWYSRIRYWNVTLRIRQSKYCRTRRRTDRWIHIMTVLKEQGITNIPKENVYYKQSKWRSWMQFTQWNTFTWKRATKINIYYYLIIHGCVNAHRGRKQFKNFLILLDIRRRSIIIMGNITPKLKRKKDISI